MFVNGSNSWVFEIAVIFRDNISEVSPVRLEITPVPSVRIQNEGAEERYVSIVFCDYVKLIFIVIEVIWPHQSDPQHIFQHLGEYSLAKMQYFLRQHQLFLAGWWRFHCHYEAFKRDLATRCPAEGVRVIEHRRSGGWGAGWVAPFIFRELLGWLPLRVDGLL